MYNKKSLSNRKPRGLRDNLEAHCIVADQLSACNSIACNKVKSRFHWSLFLIQRAMALVRLEFR